jgi:hypothetical protein
MLPVQLILTSISNRVDVDAVAVSKDVAMGMAKDLVEDVVEEAIVEVIVDVVVVEVMVVDIKRGRLIKITQNKRW